MHKGACKRSENNFSEKCGAELIDGAVFCSKCGARVGGITGSVLGKTGNKPETLN